MTHDREEVSRLVHTQETAGSNPARAIVTLINTLSYKEHWLDLILSVLFIVKKSR